METQALNVKPTVMSLEEVKGVLYLTVRGKFHEPNERQNKEAEQIKTSDHLVDTTA